MADDNNQAGKFDLFADQFTITITPFGANLTFSVREPHPAAGRTPSSQTLGTLRMSVEHLKTMVMVIKRQISLVENQTGVKVEVPRDVLRQLQIPPEDWDAFWKY